MTHATHPVPAKSPAGGGPVDAIALTDRQQFWLEHVQRCDASGNTTKDYAQAHGLSTQAMYSARKDLVQRGVLDGGGRGRVLKAPSGFARVVTPQAQTQPAQWQVALPNGATVSFQGAPDVATLERVLQTVARLT